MDLYGGYSFNPNVYSQKVTSVHGLEGAKAIQVQQCCSVILPDDTEKIMWFISSDQIGFKTVVGYSYDGPIDTTKKNDEEPVYVTTKEFDELKDRFDKLVNELGGEHK